MIPQLAVYTTYIWVFPEIGVGPPKWMVKIMENSINMDALGVKSPYFRKHPYCLRLGGYITPIAPFTGTSFPIDLSKELCKLTSCLWKQNGTRQPTTSSWKFMYEKYIKHTECNIIHINSYPSIHSSTHPSVHSSMHSSIICAIGSINSHDFHKIGDGKLNPIP